ncbi:MAG: tetratricopeptide repeat protein, partial [Myxococcaceae bacterium]
LPPLQRAVELSPKRPELRAPLASALASSGDTTAAMKQIEALLDLAPRPADIARARQVMNRLTDPFVGFPEAARPKLEQGLEWLNKADVPQQALVLFEEILRDFPDFAVVHALTGLAYQRLDDAGRAVEEFNRAIELAPRDGHAYAYLGDIYLSRQRPDAARKAFLQALERNPLLENAHLRLGDLALERQELPEATRRFETVKLLRPDDNTSRLKLALAKEMASDWLGAENELRQLLEAQPDNLELALRLSLLLAERAQRTTNVEERRTAVAEARSLLHHVLGAQPENAAASRALETLPK